MAGEEGEEGGREKGQGRREEEKGRGLIRFHFIWLNIYF